MWHTGSGVKVYLALGFTDMRKSINGLSIMVEHHLAQDPFSGHLFAFCNRRRTILKVLYWDRSGFCLWHKRLDKDKFHWPEGEDEVQEITCRQLQWLIDGLSIQQPQAYKPRRYQSVF